MYLSIHLSIHQLQCRCTNQRLRNSLIQLSIERAYIDQSNPGAAIFAGDFNTWTQDHLDAVCMCLKPKGFHLAFSWPYPGRDFPLDHVFIRGLNVLHSSHFSCDADHNGALLELAPCSDSQGEVDGLPASAVANI